MPENLTHLANKYGSDKGTKVGNRHNYTAFYSAFFEQWAPDAFTMLEIGLQRGDTATYRDPSRPVDDVPSVRLWLDYFPQAQCWGFDLSDFAHIAIPRFHFRRGDLSRPADLTQLAQDMPPARIVIDDGSHASYHQQSALLHLFTAVEPGGLYFIEDLDWQPGYENELPKCRKTRDVFGDFIKSGDLDIPFASPSQRRAVESSINNIFFLRAHSDTTELGRVKMVCLQKHK